MARMCPACHHDLQEVTSGGVTVDACVGHCGGIFFDNRELQQVDENAEKAGERFLQIPRDPDQKVDMQSKRICPKCDMKMMRHFFSVRRKIEVDECASCGGMWLDAGELARIRGEFETAEDREHAALESFEQTFSGEMAAMRKESEAKAAQASRFASLFKAICPSAYIPGKQQGGAF